MNKNNQKQKSTSHKTKLLLERNFFSVSDSFKENPIYDMINDEITQNVMKDVLIMKFGETLFKKLKKKHNANYI